MCLALYIAGSHELPVVPWREDAPAFHVEPLADSALAVREKFSGSFVYYVGGSEGCSCSFNYGREYPEYEDDPDDLATARSDRAALVAYLRANRVAEIYSCNFDEEKQPLQIRSAASADEIENGEFYFQDRQLVRVDAAA